VGSPAGERPPHEVRITRPFYLGLTEVTQAQYEQIMGTNPSYFSARGGGGGRVAGQSTDQHPVEEVSWLDAVKFCNKLSEQEGLKRFYAIEGESVRVPWWDGPGYRLPTEAEWEYACRAGPEGQGRYTFGDADDGLGDYDWFSGNSGGVTQPVGQKRPNRFGLFDMHGNVWEWCFDAYESDWYKHSTGDDPHGPDSAGAAYRVIRGGGWHDRPVSCRSANRRRDRPGSRSSYLGFRLALGQSGR
jgi:formylglycine-generating enzyme required for sulfatase activity